MIFTYKACELVNTIPRKQNKSSTGETKIKMGMPQKFGVADGASSFALGRNVYIKTDQSLQSDQDLENQVCLGQVLTSKYGSVRECGKPISSQSSGQYIDRKKNNAIGKATTNRLGDTMSFKSVDNNLVDAKLARCRSGGCVAPPKKAVSSSITSKCC